MRKIALGVGTALLAALALALTGAVITLLWRDELLDSKPVRTLLVEALYQQTGRTTEITGAIRLPGFAPAGYPWVQIEIGPGSIGNPAGYSGPALFSWSSIRLQFDLTSWNDEFPRLDSIVVDGFKLTPSIDEAGRDNFSDIGPLIDPGPAQSEWLLPSIRLSNGDLHYQDRSAQPHVEVHWANVDLRLNQVKNGALQNSDIWTVKKLEGTGSLRRLPFAEHTLATPLPSRLKIEDLRVDLETSAVSSPAVEAEVGTGRFGLAFVELGLAQQQPLKMRSQLEVSTLDLAAWFDSVGLGMSPAAADQQAMRLVFLRTKLDLIAGPETLHLRIADLETQIDETRISGELSFAKDIDIALSVDRIDLARYMPESSGAGDPTEVIDQAVRAMRELPINGSVLIGTLQVGETRMRGIALDFSSQRNLPRNR